MTEDERNMDLTIAELEQENRLLRARNERLEKELALEKMANNAIELCLDYKPQIPLDKLTLQDGNQDYINGWNECREMSLEPIENFKKRLARSIELMPFGDTAASFAVYIREFK